MAVCIRPLNPQFLWFRRTPFAFHILDAKRPLVMIEPGYRDLREDFVDAARNIPGLYMDGVHLAAMGGEPYANWN